MYQKLFGSGPLFILSSQAFSDEILAFKAYIGGYLWRLSGVHDHQQSLVVVIKISDFIAPRVTA